MPLIDLFKESEIELPQLDKHRDPNRMVFIRWINTTVPKVIRREGALFPFYEERCFSQLFFEQQGKNTFPKSCLSDNKPLKIELRKKHYFEQTLKNAYQHLRKHPTEFRPESVRQANIWWKTDTGLEKFFQKFIESEKREKRTFLTTLAEPYHSTLKNLTALSDGSIAHRYK